MYIIETKDLQAIYPYIRSFPLPQSTSHKGQNGKVLVVGGSSLFHGAVLWAAEAAALLADMTHVASTEENNDVIRTLKTKWQAGIVIPQKDIPSYAEEDGVILVGNGMMRGEKVEVHPTTPTPLAWDKILRLQDEGRFTWESVYYLLTHFPDKQYVFDAGALQMMEREWLTLCHKPALLTPHQEEFHRLFGVEVKQLSLEEKCAVVAKTAQQYHSVILLKAIDDIVSDGKKTVIIRGGNAGLTKGGTGDLLAGIATGILTHTDVFTSAVFASFLLKKTADELFSMKGYWYSVHDLLQAFPGVLAGLTRARI